MKLAKPKISNSISKDSALSKKGLFIFAGAFAIIGAFLLIKSFAATTLITKLEAEQMILSAGEKVVTSPTGSGGKSVHLNYNGSATGQVSFPSSITSLTVMAAGSQCYGAPHMTLNVDGVNLLTNVSVTSSSWQAFSIAHNYGAGVHTLKISFNNDYAKSGVCDRNLYLDVTRFYGPAVITPPPTISLSATPTKVSTGQSSTLTWKATNASSCTASGSWNGAVPTSGSQSTGALNVASTYSLACTGSGGTAKASVTVSIGTAAPPPSSNSYIPTYYVSANGSDSNSGTSAASPWRTIAKAKSVCMSPGQVIAFEGGQTYNDTWFGPRCMGTVSAPIVVTSYGTGRAEIAGGVWLDGGTHNITFDDLDFTDSASGIIASCGSCSANPTYDIIIQNSIIHDTPSTGLQCNPNDHNWLIRHNTFRHIGDSGLITYYCRDIVITGNTINDTGWNAAITYGKHGIYSKSVGSEISYNDISGNAGGGAVSIRTHGQRIFGNALHDTMYPLAFFNYDNKAQDPGVATYIYYNRMWNIGGYGFYYDNGLDPSGQVSTVNFVIANNTFVFNNASEGFNFSLTPSTAHVTFANNIATGTFGNAFRTCPTCSEYNNIWNGGASMPHGTGDIVANPLVGGAPGLALPSNSPAIDRGSLSVPGLSYTVSADGAPLHYQSSAPDMGAVESPY